ncbi:MAG TPA: isocitrate lyase/phosphoenolpyruvate mutase family protein [Bryobacteraceae bacterium]|jgi:2-methylisocitrate lyase-like PEP mutase family enzyme|nr:isocitrate lyase/phosphoenolpyruvate mutase family protein [Bryobacteraceae bacterium]
MASFSAQCTLFRDLHASGCFVIPNPWNAGTAKYLRRLGFRALATTSAGAAFARGLPDGAVSLNEMLGHISEMVQATELPVNADFGAGFGDEPEQVAQNVKACVQTGVAGLSIEDATGSDATPLYEFSVAVDRIKAARAAIDESGSGALLTARAECYLTGHPKPFAESIRRLQAYADAGADVLYAPGVTKREEMRKIVAAAAPKPVNILMSSDLGMNVSDLAEMGVRRISVGSALARTAWSGFIRAAKEIAEQGSFGAFAGLTPHAELDRFFREESMEAGKR